MNKYPPDTLREELERALGDPRAHGLTLHYQPIVRVETGELVEVEALARWQHPTLGAVPPSTFIPLAEESGAIVRLGKWVLRLASAQAKAWAAGGRPVVVGINLSTRQFKQPGSVAGVAAAVDGLAPELLKLEITESAAAEDGEATIRTLEALRALGVRLALDDFGTGYSSLSYLRRFPVDTLKIDRSFVSGLGREPQDDAIVRAIVALGHALDLSITAEGVETDRQLERLQTLGADRAQGFLFSRAVSADALAVLLRR